jgi:hypothetical protein
VRTLTARERKRRAALLMKLRRVRGQLNPAQIEIEDPDAEEPECSWCGEPASEQVLTGWSRPNPDAAPVAHFAWLCDRDATDYKNERDISRGQ